MPLAADLDTFRPYSAMHGAVVIAIAVLAILFALARRRRRQAHSGARMDRAFAAVSAIAFIVINARQMLSDDFSPRTALPLHVSDLTMLAIPIALWTCRRLPRAVVYYWGIALGSLAFIMPDLRDGPARVGFWLFWTGHAIMLIAIVYDLLGRAYRPGWRDWRTAAIVSLAYAALILPFNAVTGHSYGYLGPDQPDQPAALAFFGPWPARAAPMVLTGIAVMALLTVPWKLARHETARSRTL